MRSILIIGILLLAVLCMLSYERPEPPPPAVVVVVDPPSFVRAKKEEIPLIIRTMYTHAHGPDVWQGLLQLGDIYKRGEYPLFLPNKDLALACYRGVALRCPDAHTQGLAHAKIFEDDVLPGDSAGDRLPEEPASILLQRTATAAATPQKTTPPKPIHPLPPPPPLPPIIIRTDTQNVHDHGVMASLKRNVQRMPLVGTNDDVKEAVESTLFACTDMDDTEKAKALHVLESLGTESTHSSLEVSESEALAKTWHRISQLDDPGIRANAKETLVKQLASGVQNGCIVCSTGKIARIVGALDGIDDMQTTSKPMWAVREELGSLAAKMRDSGKGDEQFRKEATEIYIDTLGMSPRVLDPLIEVYASAF